MKKIEKLKSFERKDELIKAALDEFIQTDYEKASLNNIIKNAQISKGTFYYHFENKEALYLYLLENSANVKWTFINENSGKDQEQFAKMNLFDKFIYQAELGYEFAKRYPQYYQLSLRLSKEKNHPIYTKAIAYLGGNSEALMRQMIDAAYENHELDHHFDKEFIIKVLAYQFMHYDSIFDEVTDLEFNMKNLKLYVEFLKKGFSHKGDR
ncbi:TetR/AcrR family transcriptional regulator [Fusibacter bizertensis]|uniref:TetR/AcrR family transcriptional regulator n=1 Tax=Fusibacter bizertensis TaxID=1488331 RepID=A0ABT6N8Q5_9FIRM|nr:TetR/AcrR family transcriptional regulator [Fusibacter bizertensis]MDH8676802.1 TetR/AcrR family transcriptional regulator [Fusibacter bizertensis]